jgi:hypothetical protein|tara:strand:+ start:462 stop:881 length:420 start_codon:yes stop_codon:yes gene_type:complete
MKLIIYQNKEGGVSVVYPTGEVAVEELPARLGLSDYEIVEDSVIPADRSFRDAWRKDGKQVVEDLPAAKEIAHATRRAKREDEFKPYDDVIAKQIPGADAEAAETARGAIRAKYATMQVGIDNAASTAEIKTALEGGGS